MKNLRRKLLSQNFLRSRKLVSTLVGKSSIGKTDLVLEIGSGGGIVTEALLNRAQLVIGVEIDPYWYQRLQTQYSDRSNLLLHQGDFLSYPLPRLPYKVFANIPFAIEGKIIRRLLDADNPPLDCYLVVLQSFAKRLAIDGHNSLFAASYGPWFTFSVVHHFRKSDFSPEPSVDASLFRFVRRASPLLPFSVRKRYQQFVKLGYQDGKAIRRHLGKRYSRDRVDAALHSLSIPRRSKPSELTTQQWVNLFIKYES